MKAVSLRSLRARCIAAFLSGLMGSLALPPISLIIFLPVLAVPFALLATSPNNREALWLGWATGFGWFVFSLWWISTAFVTSGGGHVLLIPFAALGLPLLLGVFWGAAFWATAKLAKTGTSRLLLGVVMVSLAEYARGVVLTGFPWNAPGMIFVDHEILLAAASFFGLWGLTVLALLIGVLPLLILAGLKRQAMVITTLLLLVPVIGKMHLSKEEIPSATTDLQISIIQPNIPQRDKWDRQKRPDHLVRLMELSRRYDGARPELIIWPETAFAGFIPDNKAVFDAVAGVVTDGFAALMTGALHLEEGRRLKFFNTAVLVDRKGEITSRYDKQHLVPFGEYAPLRQFLPFIDALAGPNDFSAGKGLAPVEVMRLDGQVISLLPLICYEVIFPGDVRKAALGRDADLIVTITNDAWFGDTIGPRQHLAMAQIRSAELGLPMLRAANTGISAVISSKGAVLHALDYGREGVIEARLGGMVETFYHRFGDLIFCLLLLALVMMAVLQQGLTRLDFRR